MSFIIGLTGGIGSGKTVVSNHFASLGVPIIDTDVIARRVVEPGKPALKQLVTTFGDNILTKSGELDRAALRKIAFSSEKNKQLLDQITHPAIRIETLKQIDDVTFPYSIVVVPLLKPDTEFSKLMHRTLVVTADHETKVQRVIKRSQLSREEVETIMQTQSSDDQRLAFADDVISNDGSIEETQTEVEKLHEVYLGIATN